MCTLGAAGARTRQPENSKRSHLRVPAFENTTKIPREDTQRDTKRATIVAGERGKSAPSGQLHDTHQIQKWIGQNWLGQSRPQPPFAVEEWSRASTSGRCQCSQGSRVRHVSSRSRGWDHQGRPRSCVEARQGTEQSGAPVPEVTFVGSPGQGGRSWKQLSSLWQISQARKVDVLQAALTRAKSAAVAPPLNVRVVQCQQFRRADCEAHRGVGQSARSQVRTGCRKGGQRLQRLHQGRCRCTIRSRSPRGPGRVIRSGSFARSGCPPPGKVGNKGFRRGPCRIGLPRRQCAGESVEERSSPKISCARQWRSSFSGSTRGSPTSRTPSPQAMQPKSAAGLMAEGTVQ